MTNPYLARVAKRGQLTNSHRRAVKQESELAKRVKGIQTAASGSREVKGDVRKRGVMRIEAKTTKNKSFSVTLDMVRKIMDAAVGSAEVPVIVVEFNDGFNKRIAEIAVVPTYVLDDLYKR